MANQFVLKLKELAGLKHGKYLHFRVKIEDFDPQVSSTGPKDWVVWVEDTADELSPDAVVGPSGIDALIAYIVQITKL